jgi:hypothetical protein
MRRRSIYKDCSRSPEDFTIVGEVCGQKRKNEIEMRELAAVVTKGDHLAAAFAGPADESAVRGNLVSDFAVILHSGTVTVPTG